MRPPGRGILNGTGLILLCLSATLAALFIPLWWYDDECAAAADPLAAQTLSTRYGPLSAQDQRLSADLGEVRRWGPEAGRQAHHGRRTGCGRWRRRDTSTTRHWRATRVPGRSSRWRR
ncbi:hypothetical protein ABZX40_18535 [Streptomyces sp. NPDC004610]|uniref:hypothetical protein n=1 Tax=unclassified Streptomyces TaxID=2593676 RepID=UPI0033A44CDC